MFRFNVTSIEFGISIVSAAANPTSNFRTRRRLALNFCVARLIALAVFIGLPGTSWAGGLYLNEFNSPSMGVAGAGAQAVAVDASTAWHNPAGMTRLDGNQLMGGTGLLYGGVEFESDKPPAIPGNDGGEAMAAPAPLITGFYSHSLSDDLKVGIGLLSLSGAALDYSDDWTGRFLVQDVELLTLSAQPAVAYRVNDWLSVGGGVNVMYATLDLDLAAPIPGLPDGQISLDGDDVGVGFNLSTLIELSPRTRLGLSYQSKIDLKFSGDIDISPIGAAAGVDTELTLPQFVRVGIYHELNDQFALLGTVGWDDWSVLDNLFVSTELVSMAIPRNWKDTYHISGGIQYRPTDDWLLQAGIAYDSSPVDEEDRTPDMPMDRQIRYAIGAQYRWSEDINVGASLEFIDMGDAEIDRPFLKGEYDENFLVALGLHLSWKF